MAYQSANLRPAPPNQTDIIRSIIEQGLATREELDACLARQGDAAGPEGDRRLEGILIEQRVVTPSQLARVYKALEATGRHIPGYQVICRLGSGSMATVFKARQVSLDRLVAIKVLSRKLSENREYVERFYREGKAAAQLNHPNIVQAIDVGEANGYHYFVMEYVDGCALHEDLQAGKVFSEPEALSIITQIARALEHAHAQGFIHRDVKPKNIMIARDGTAKLADMGLARAASDYEAAQAEAGKAFGTPFYISPEQIRGEVDIDFRSDIYSLGATLYHLVTGREPFQAPTLLGVMHKHLYEPLVPPDHITTSLSTGLAEVVEVMMAKERRRRYASTSDLLVDLESIAAGGPPLQAHRQIDADTLTGLADEAPNSPDPPSGMRLDLVVYLILLGVILALSVALNVILLAKA